jgi:DNA-binding transcriptional LysR family regulator
MERPRCLVRRWPEFGLAYVPEDVAQPHLAKGRLKRVLEDWRPPFSGYHLYYPSRRQLTPAFALLVETLRYRRS